MVATSKPEGWSCPECGEGPVRVINAVYATCEECGAEFERGEVGI